MLAYEDLPDVAENQVAMEEQLSHVDTSHLPEWFLRYKLRRYTVPTPSVKFAELVRTDVTWPTFVTPHHDSHVDNSDRWGVVFVCIRDPRLVNPDARALLQLRRATEFIHALATASTVFSIRMVLIGDVVGVKADPALSGRELGDIHEAFSEEVRALTRVHRMCDNVDHLGAAPSVVIADNNSTLFVPRKAFRSGANYSMRPFVEHVNKAKCHLYRTVGLFTHGPSRPNVQTLTVGCVGLTDVSRRTDGAEQYADNVLRVQGNAIAKAHDHNCFLVVAHPNDTLLYPHAHKVSALHYVPDGTPCLPAVHFVPLPTRPLGYVNVLRLGGDRSVSVINVAHPTLPVVAIMTRNAVFQTCGDNPGASSFWGWDMGFLPEFIYPLTAARAKTLPWVITGYKNV